MKRAACSLFSVKIPSECAVLWLAMLMPLLMNVFYLLRLGPLHGFTLAYFGCLATGLLLGWAMLRGRLLDLTPIARTVLLEHMAEAVVVLDARGRVTDFNPRAAHWFGCGAAALGQPGVGRSAPAIWFGWEGR